MSESDQGRYCAIYARFSDKNQKELSIEGQLRECRALAAKMGISVIAEYIDRAISGKSDARPEFQRMIADSAKKRFGFVLAWKMDRLARNRYDSAIYKARLKANGVKLAYVADNIPDGPEGIILESMLEGMAEYYSANLAENVKRGMKDTAMKCRYTGGPVALGYKIVDGQFVIDDLTAPIVRDCFAWAADKVSHGQICKRVAEKYGYKILRHKVELMLSNKKYIGVFSFGQKWDEEVVVEGGVPAIVDRDVFAKVEALREIAKGHPRLNRPKEPNALVGKLSCGQCGRQMFQKICRYPKYTYRYYACDGPKEGDCQQLYIKAEKLDEDVFRLICSEVLTPEAIDKIARRAGEIQEADSGVEDDSEKELRAVQRSIGNVMAAIEQGIITPTTKTRLESLEKRQAELIEEISAKAKRSAMALTADQVRAFFSSFREGDINNPVFRKRVCDLFIRKVVIYDKERAEVHLNVTGSATDGFVVLPLSAHLRGQFDKIEYRLPGKPARYARGVSKTQSAAM